ncbi:hypothetical protein MKW94_014859 [Papaver nudicaule]|uniref:K Homology domain-containing protein n=1 Tax=Papaver nudicaule TaxID=74823 RepID=A0AA41VUU9_PAPNU|nr:hypothetical protein [Papaver nudicaule]
MSFSVTPSKRPHDRNEPNGKGKWQKTQGYYPPLQPLKISPGSVVFRVLCPVSKSGSVIGKGGTIVSQIRHDTGAKVRVEEPIPGDDERVIFIVGPEKEVVEVNGEQIKQDGGNNNGVNVGGDVKENDNKGNEVEVETESNKHVVDMEVKEEKGVEDDMEVKEESKEVKEETKEIKVEMGVEDDMEVKEETKEVEEEKGVEDSKEGLKSEEVKEEMGVEDDFKSKEVKEEMGVADDKEDSKSEEAKEEKVIEDEVKEDSKSNEVKEKGNEDVKEHSELNEVKDTALVEGSQAEKGIPAVQRALFLVFERMVEGDLEGDEGEKAPTVVRLLVLSTQVGCLLGKGGSVIKQMASDSGAQIRILPRDKLPLCASQTDELVQLTGGLDAVRKALQSVSQQLLDNPPRDRDTFPANKHTGSSTNSFGSPVPKSDVRPPPNHHFSGQGATYAAGPHDRADFEHPPPKYHEHVIPNRMEPVQAITFRLLCFNESVGGVIGKGGTIVKALQHESGCEIKVLDSIPDSEDRIILITGPVHPDDRLSAAQDGVLRVQNRIARAVSDNGEKVLARILVSSNQIGCILGKGGSIITDIRKFTGAYIRIVARDQMPKWTSDIDEIVQMSGEFAAVQEALVQITGRLQHHFFRDMYPSVNHPPHPPFADQVAPYPPFGGRRDRSPPGMYSNIGPPFHNFDGVGGFPPHGLVHHHDERFAHNSHGQGNPHLSSGRLPPPAPWEHQGMRDTGGPLGIPDYAGGPPHRRNAGFGGGNQPAFITSTTIEVSVPRAVVPSIYGENGNSLKQIRQISGAKITITDSRPGATDTAIILSGTPEQTHAAQSLLQAFVMAGSGSP